jgi:bifunctional oligoribonuclease and PAP phosphatase NrnA
MKNFDSSRLCEILKDSKRAVLFCHESPDYDSIISCLLMRNILTQMGVSSEIYSVDKIPENFKEGEQDFKIKESADVNKLNLENFDVMFALDINDIARLGFRNEFKSRIVVINIDHHQELNNINSRLSWLDTTFSSTSEMLFYLSLDLNIKIEKELIQLILLAILTDTDMFNYVASGRVFKTVGTLIEQGANYEAANFKVMRQNTLDQFGFWAEMLKNMKKDDRFGFVYTMINNESFKKYNHLLQATRKVADNFARTVKGTNFGLVMVEAKPNELKVSIRSRIMKFGVIELLKELGGGGHLDGGGATITGMEFDDAVNYVLNKTREFVKKRE